jgi:hypothetical protein
MIIVRNRGMCGGVGWSLWMWSRITYEDWDNARFVSMKNRAVEHILGSRNGNILMVFVGNWEAIRTHGSSQL